MIALGYDVRDVHGNRNHKIYDDGKELTERSQSLCRTRVTKVGSPSGPI